jgi:hypothetical protein
MSLEMEYKICDPLKTRQVEPWEKYMFDNHLFTAAPITANRNAIVKAVEFGWYDGEAPKIEQIDDPKVILELGTQVVQAYNAIMGFNVKNSRAARQTTPKA